MSGTTHTFEGELVELDGTERRIAVDVGDGTRGRMVSLPMSIECMRAVGGCLYGRVRVTITVEPLGAEVTP